MWREGGYGERVDVEKLSVWGVLDITVCAYLSHFLLYSSDFLHAPIFPQNVNTLFYYFCLKNDSIISFLMWKGGWWMWRDGGSVDVE